MKSVLLLPHRFRLWGWILIVPSTLLLIAVLMYEYSVPFLKLSQPVHAANLLDFNNYDLSDEFTVLLVFASLFMIAFSKEKVEDEYIRAIRLKALQISVYVNYLVLVIGIVSFYGLNFLYVLYGNLFTILIIFILVYQYYVSIKPRLSKSVSA